MTRRRVSCDFVVSVIRYAWFSVHAPSRGLSSDGSARGAASAARRIVRRHPASRAMARRSGPVVASPLAARSGRACAAGERSWRQARFRRRWTRVACQVEAGHAVWSTPPVRRARCGGVDRQDNDPTVATIATSRVDRHTNVGGRPIGTGSCLGTVAVGRVRENGNARWGRPQTRAAGYVGTHPTRPAGHPTVTSP